MKPKTKLHKAVVRSIKMLPTLSRHQKEEAINAMPHIAKCNSKGEYTCLECGHHWHEKKSESVVCPNCSRTLNVETDRKRNYKLTDYFAVVTKCNGFQVIRMILVKSILRQGTQANYQVMEVFQRWITPQGESVIVGKRRACFTYYIDIWDIDSDMDVNSN